MLNDKVDEELLVDKERPVKKLDTSYVTPGVCRCRILRYTLLDVSLVSRLGHSMIPQRGPRYCYGPKNVLP